MQKPLDKVAVINPLEARERVVSRGIDPDKSGYRVAGFLIGEVAFGLGMETTELDYTHWVLTKGIFRAVDQLVDHEKLDDLSEQISMLSAGMPVDGYVTTAEAELFAELLGNYDISRRVTQINGFSVWPALQVARCDASELGAYIRSVIDEHKVYTALLATVDPFTPDSQGVIRADVNRWINSAFLSGYFVDSAHDLRDDFNEGACRVEPTMRNKLTLARLAIDRSTLRTIRQVPFRSMPKVGRLLLNYGFK